VTSVQNWIAGARPKTLGAALAPVLIGTSIAINQDSFMPVNAGLALVVALFLQIAVNYANDYSDGIKGVDANRVGPIRLVGSGLAPAARVKMAAIYCVLIASVSGLVLSLRTELWLVLVGLIAILASWPTPEVRILTATAGLAKYQFSYSLVLWQQLAQALCKLEKLVGFCSSLRYLLVY
jgi:1,4-dihydroxy-2-naphthoate octaprenyltransferase